MALEIHGPASGLFGLGLSIDTPGGADEPRAGHASLRFRSFLAQCFEPHGARYEPAAMQVLAGGNGAREKASRHARDRAAPAFRRAPECRIIRRTALAGGCGAMKARPFADAHLPDGAASMRKARGFEAQWMVAHDARPGIEGNACSLAWGINERIRVSVIIADDHPVTGHGIAQTLAAVPTIQVGAVVSNTTELIVKLDAGSYDVVVLDYVMPGQQYGDGLTLLAYLARRYPQLRIVTMTMLDSPPVFRAMQKIGVQCVVSKSDAMSHLVAAVHAAVTQGQYLSPTVVELLRRPDPAPRRTCPNASPRSSACSARAIRSPKSPKSSTAARRPSARRSWPPCASWASPAMPT